jgi:hypothetical protein
MDRWMDHYGYHGPAETATRFADRLDRRVRRRTGRGLPRPAWQVVRAVAVGVLTVVVRGASGYRWLAALDRRIADRLTALLPDRP